MWNNTHLAKRLKQQKSRLPDDLAARRAAAAVLLHYPAHQWLIEGSQVASGGKRMISTMSSSTQAMKGSAER